MGHHGNGRDMLSRQFFLCPDCRRGLKTIKQRYGELFGVEFDVLLYDLTSTSVEGAAEKNAMMGRGYSRDHRPDCEQMVMALMSMFSSPLSLLYALSIHPKIY